jgi:hypothetical protein
MQDRLRDPALDIAGQMEAQVGRRAGDILEAGRQRLPDADRLIPSQLLQCAHGQLKKLALRFTRQVGQQTGELGRQQAAHAFVGIAREHDAGLRGCRRIGRHFAAHFDSGIDRQIIEQFGPDILAPRHPRTDGGIVALRHQLGGFVFVRADGR